MRAEAALATAIAAGIAGCGGGGTKPLPAACSAGPRSVLAALRTAPGPVGLPDGTRLSDCVARAYDDGELQQLGFALTPAADALAARATPAAALQLGYLVGAVQRGAARTNGVHLQLVRRLESTVTFTAGPLLDAARRGRRAGEAGG